MPWSPSKTSGKTMHGTSIMAVSKGDIMESLSPIKTFMVERNAQKNNIQNFTEYMAVAQAEKLEKRPL